MDRRQHLSEADFHMPTSLIGATLLLGIEKDCFKLIRNHIDQYISNAFDLSRLMKVIDYVEETKRLGHRRSMVILNHVMTYLRVKLLSRELRVIELSIVMIDLLVKNCSYRIHILVGNRVFMKTIGIVARQLLVDQRDKCRRVGRRIIDILQGWGEAFSRGERRYIYPNIVATYEKMRCKYGVKYQRPDFDPSRVPIFLEAIHKEEILASPSRGRAANTSSDNIDEKKWELELSNGSLNTPSLNRIVSGDDFDDNEWELESINVSVNTASQIRKICGDNVGEKGWDGDDIDESISSNRACDAETTVGFTAESDQKEQSMVNHINKLERMYAIRGKEIQLSADSGPSGRQYKDDKSTKSYFDPDTRVDTTMTTAETPTTTPDATMIANLDSCCIELQPIIEDFQFDCDTGVDTTMTTLETPTATPDTAMMASPRTFSTNLDSSRESIEFQPIIDSTKATVNAPIKVPPVIVSPKNVISDRRSLLRDQVDGPRSLPFMRVRNFDSSKISGQVDVNRVPTDFEMYLMKRKASREANNWSENTSDSDEDIAVDVKLDKEDTSLFNSIPSASDYSCDEIEMKSHALEITTDINEAEGNDDPLLSDTKTSRGSSSTRYSRICMSPDKGKLRYISPSSDPTLSIKYFGHQRILVRTDRK